MKGVPTLIRGTLYPSMRAAAQTLSLHPQTIFQAAERGTLDNVGCGKPGAPGVPCTINGKRWPSQSAAARAIGVRPASISRAIAAGRGHVRPGGKGEFA